jgi:hypothetical protein
MTTKGSDIVKKALKTAYDRTPEAGSGPNQDKPGGEVLFMSELSAPGLFEFYNFKHTLGDLSMCKTRSVINIGDVRGINISASPKKRV